MTLFPSSSASVVGRLTGFVLGLVVFICVMMIGGTGYLKYQIDRAEIVLAAPDGALGGDQALDHLRRELGYGGFLGLAQKYALTHDGALFGDMKAHIRTADEVIANLPDKTPAEMRHEVLAITFLFDETLQKINAPAEAGKEFSSADLAPLYAAMPILDARIGSSNAEARFAAQSKMQFWSMILTVVCWSSLILAAGCVVGIYLTLRDKQAAPLRALSQSIQNMARGDMRAPIWGIERQDVIGELARSVDMARYHFSHLPDVSVLSDQGPVRMRFEGETRSLFEAMMKAISRDSENIRDYSSGLTQTAQKQREEITSLSEKVETILQSILNRGQDGDKQIRQAIHEMVGSAEGLKNAHAHAADQLNRLIPHMQERATGMAEITHIAGKQIAQMLQSMSTSELDVKANAAHARETLLKLSTTADDLGERMFGAINLLQAGGKVLSETTDHLKEARSFLTPSGAVDLAPLAQRLDDIGAQLSLMQEKRGDEVFVPSVQREEGATPPLAGILLSEVEALITTRLEPKFVELEQNILQNGSEAAAQMRNALSELGDKLGVFRQAPADTSQESLRVENAATQAEWRETLAGLADKIEILTSALPVNLRQNLQEDLLKLSAQLSATREEIAQAINAGIEPKFAALTQNLSQTENVVAAQTRGAMEALGGRIEAVMSALPKDSAAEIQSGIAQLSSQLGATREAIMQEIGERIEPKFSALEQGFKQASTEGVAHMRTVLGSLAGRIDALLSALPKDSSPAIREDISKLSTQIGGVRETLGAIETKNEIASLADKILALQGSVSSLLAPGVVASRQDLSARLSDMGLQLAAQIEASRSGIDLSLRQDVGTRLVAVEQALSATRRDVEVVRIEASKPVTPIIHLPPEIQKQMHDHWFQMSAQIEATRASLVESLAHQIEKMETRLGDRREPVSGKIPSDAATQRQIQQQTQILSELVATMGLLDAHMQQIKSEIHVAGG